MVLKVSLKEQDNHKFFWSCSSNPKCNNTEKTILKKMPNYFGYFTPLVSHYKSESWNINSMAYLRPNDIVSDAERHYSINNKFEYDLKFHQVHIENLDIFLGFESRNDFYFWIATQQWMIHGSYKYLNVGSPYYFTFINLTKSINQYYGDIINKIVEEQHSTINLSIAEWDIFFDLIKRKGEEAQIVSEEGPKAIKAKKASINIFRAIRRKDIKAIVALRKNGADLSYKNNKGLNYIEYARTFNCEKVIEALTINLSELKD